MGRSLMIAAMAALGLFAASMPASAQTSPVVVELFTSQGCSSCPPADEFLGRIADRDDVIALSMHVDYWDYLGWRDIFATAAHTERQRDYARSLGERMVYTPQVIVQGSEGMVGSRTVEVEGAISRHLKVASPATVDLSLANDRLVARISPNAEGRVRSKVMMVWFSRVERVDVGAGENSGRTLVYHNVVKGWSDMGQWRGEQVDLTAPKPMGADGVAVLVQDISGPIIGAGQYRMK